MSHHGLAMGHGPPWHTAMGFHGIRPWHCRLPWRCHGGAIQAHGSALARHKGARVRATVAVLPLHGLRELPTIVMAFATMPLPRHRRPMERAMHECVIVR